MEFSEVLNYTLYTILTAILPIVAAYAVNLLKTKIKESNSILEATKNETMAKRIENALSDVMDAVLYVNQVYTDSLKVSGTFDREAQDKAYNRAYAEAMLMISEETKKIIGELYGSFDHWLQQKIEASVNAAKKQ